MVYRNNVHYPRCTNIVLSFILIVLCYAPVLAQKTTSLYIQGGYSNQLFFDMEGVGLNLGIIQRLNNRLSISGSYYLHTPRGNKNFVDNTALRYLIIHEHYEWLGLRFLAGTPGFDQPFYYSTPIKTALSNQASFIATLEYTILDKDRHTLNLGLGFHYSRVKLTFIYDSVLTVRDYWADDFNDEVILLVPLFHRFHSFSFVTKMPYQFKINDRLSLRLDPYYAHMRGWRGFWGVHTGIVVDM